MTKWNSQGYWEVNRRDKIRKWMFVDLILYWSTKWLVTPLRSEQGLSTVEKKEALHILLPTLSGCTSWQWKTRFSVSLSQVQIITSPNIPFLQRKYGSVTRNSGQTGSNKLSVKTGGKNIRYILILRNNLTIMQLQNTSWKDFIHMGEFLHIK